MSFRPPVGCPELVLAHECENIEAASSPRIGMAGKYRANNLFISNVVSDDGLYAVNLMQTVNHTFKAFPVVNHHFNESLDDALFR